MERASRLSARLDDSVARRLEHRSARTDTKKSRLAERYIDEGLRMDEHPGVVFRDGPAGRRAGLAAGPDVWEVMSVIRAGKKKGDTAVSNAAQVLDLTEDQIRIAVRYYTQFQDEIDARIRRNEEEAEAAEAAWRREQAALA
ncbi:MAG: hypothetical protein ACRDQB_09420 [Thermocrispum sp.]